MSKCEKLLERIRNLDKGLRFEELQKVLERIGYKLDAPVSGSSYRTFRKQGAMPVTIPKHKPLKKVYIGIIRDVLIREGVIK